MPTFTEPRLCTVYKIFNHSDPNDENFYIGSTVIILKNRVWHHKDYYNKGKNLKLYNHMRSNGGWDCFRFEVVEAKIVNSTQEQYLCEQNHIDSLKPTLNDYRAHNTPEDTKRSAKIYRQKNKERLSQKSKEYHLKNKEAIKAKKKTYNAEHKEESKARHVKWKASNLQHLKEYKKQYYLKNKARISEKCKKNYTNGKKAKMLAKVQCGCGAAVSASYLKKHKLTDKHKKLLKASKSE